MANIAVFGSFLLEMAASLFQAEKASLWVREGTSKDFQILCSTALPAEIFRNCRTRLGEGIAGRVARRRRAVFVPAIEKDPCFSRHRRYGSGPPSFIACPIICRNRLLGLLTMSGKRNGKPFEENDFSLACALVEQAAVPFEHFLPIPPLPSRIPAEEDSRERLARFSGEWRNRLHSIHGAVYLLRNERKHTSPEQDDFLTIIARETRKLLQMADTQFSPRQWGISGASGPENPSPEPFHPSLEDTD